MGGSNKEILHIIFDQKYFFLVLSSLHGYIEDFDTSNIQKLPNETILEWQSTIVLIGPIIDKQLFDHWFTDSRICLFQSYPCWCSSPEFLSEWLRLERDIGCNSIYIEMNIIKELSCITYYVQTLSQYVNQRVCSIVLYLITFSLIIQSLRFKRIINASIYSSVYSSPKR